MRSVGIYVHIPFCIRKCNYCNFNSFESASLKQIKSYVQALLKDIEISSKVCNEYTVSSIYIGGGTPSYVDAGYIDAIIAQIRKCFKLSSNPEIAIEVNPNSISTAKLLIYKKAGVNRISMGVQSFNNKFLKLLGRQHSAACAVRALELIKKQGFSNISIDLIYGIPGQSLADWEKELSKAVEMDVNHISLYDLVIEENTPFYNMRDDIIIANNDLQALMYKKADSYLTKNQFKHYEISSFARNNKKSKHNLIYWNNLEYLGLGAGAYSYIQRQRFSKAAYLKQYIQQANKACFEPENSEILEPRKLIEETLILRLRILKRFKISDIEESTDQKIPEDLILVLNEFVENGFILHKQGYYQLSKKGLLHYDSIACELLS